MVQPLPNLYHSSLTDVIMEAVSCKLLQSLQGNRFLQGPSRGIAYSRVPPGESLPPGSLQGNRFLQGPSRGIAYSRVPPGESLPPGSLQRPSECYLSVPGRTVRMGLHLREASRGWILYTTYYPEMFDFTKTKTGPARPSGGTCYW